MTCFFEAIIFISIYANAQMPSRANKISEILKCRNVGMHVSDIWLCCPSAFNPDVGPKVVSEAGEPASPRAAAAAIKTIIC